MKLHVLSDLHLSASPLEPPQTDADVVVLAGDIARPAQAMDWARALGKPTLFVPGNHEFYGGSLQSTPAQLKQLAGAGDLHVLDNDAWVFAGVRFLGTTLWTDFLATGDGAQRDLAMQQGASFMRDFSKIRLNDVSEEVFTPQHSTALFGQQLRWLQDQLAQPFAGPTVVVTHHAPSLQSIHPRFAGSPLNACFVSDAERLMGGDRVALWIHGHTHDSFDYRVNGTRVLCNPRGYAKEGINENPQFDPHLVVALA